MTRGLLIKMSSLGDVIHALPAVTDAAEHGVVFDWVVEENFAPVPALHPGVHAVLPIAWRRWRKSLLTDRESMRRFFNRLREVRYDVILDSQGLIKSAAVSRLARGDQRAGFARSSAREGTSALGLDKPVHVALDLHAVDRQRKLFAAVFGYEIPDGLTYGIGRGGIGREGIGRVNSEITRSVLLLHGTTWPAKHYPEVMWQELIALALKDGCDVQVVFGSAEEERLARRLERAGARVLPSRSLAELLEHIRSVGVVIGVDTGLCHVAAALDRPVIGLYGPTDPNLTGVRGRRVQNLVTNLDCAPCRRPDCSRADRAQHAVDPPCFSVLPPAQVWEAARQMLTRI
jgi:heptosyltransferase-1